MCTDKTASVFTMSQLAMTLAFAVNHPHFLSSYMLLYHDFGGNIKTRSRYFWAGVVVPVLLGGYLAYGFSAGRVDLLGHALNAMFFLVGWHYVKQVFGCIIVTSARRKYFYNSWERRTILANLFSIWAVSFFNGQYGSGSFTFYGITYPSLGLPTGLIGFAKTAVLFSGFAVVGLHLRKYIETGAKPSAPGMAALLALYVWYLPVFSHPSYAYLIPFFHSMQYLAFVWSFKKNQVTDKISSLKNRERRTAWVKGFLGYAVMALILGAMAFEYVPKFLDSQQLLQNPALGTSPFLAAFLIFINIHHYFIDNVIWRSDNEQVKKYLFASPPSEEAQVHEIKRRAA